MSEVRETCQHFTLRDARGTRFTSGTSGGRPRSPSRFRDPSPLFDLLLQIGRVGEAFHDSPRPRQTKVAWSWAETLPARDERSRKIYLAPVALHALLEVGALDRLRELAPNCGICLRGRALRLLVPSP